MNLQCVLPEVLLLVLLYHLHKHYKQKVSKMLFFIVLAEVAVILSMWLFFFFLCSLTSVLAKLRGTAVWCE